MVNRLRLNEKAVRDAEPAEGRDYQIFDTDVRGFAVCVRAPGSRGQGFRCDADSDSDLARTRFRGTRTSFREAGSGC